MLLTAAYIAAAFACMLAIALARSDRRYVALAVWIGLASLYGITSDHVFPPILAAAHAPYQGRARVALHVMQFLFLATQNAFLCAALITFRTQRRLVVVAALSTFIPMTLLVGGYINARIPGAYSLAGISFHSVTIATWWCGAATVVAWIVIAPGVTKTSWLDLDAFDRALVGSVFVTAVIDVARIGLPFTRFQSSSWAAVPAINLVAYAIVATFLAAAIAVESRLLVGSRADGEIKRERSKAMHRMDRRLRLSRRALAEPRPPKREIATFLNRRPHLRDLVLTETKLALLFDADEADTSAIDALEKVVAILGSVHESEREPILDEAVVSFDRSTKRPATPGSPRWPNGLIIPQDDLVAASRLVFVVPMLAAVDALQNQIAMSVFLMASVALRVGSASVATELSHSILDAKRMLN